MPEMQWDLLSSAEPAFRINKITQQYMPHIWGWSSFCKFLKSADPAWEGELLTKKASFLYSSFAGYYCVSRHCHKRGQRVRTLSRSNRKRGSLTSLGKVSTADAEVSPQLSPPSPWLQTLTLTAVQI